MLRLLLCFLAAELVFGQDCANLEFEDGALGTLVPCTWESARGMLCMKDAQDTVIWPGVSESAQMAACGIGMPKKKSKTNVRGRRSLAAETWKETEALEAIRARRKRDSDDEDFNLYNEDESISSEGFRGTTYDFQKILKDLVKNEWGLQEMADIEPTVELWIENNVTLSRDEESGIYRALVAPAGQFDPDDTSGKKAINVVRRLLSEKKNRENWEWLDVKRISDEFELCYRSDYSSVANEDVLFDAPDYVPKTLDEIAELEQNGSNPKSTLHYWYYRMSCLKHQKRIFVTMVIYTDKMTFDDVERTVDDWINTPETQVKWINQTVERIKATKKEVVVYDEHRESGQKCHKVKGKSGKSSSHCEPFENINKTPRKLELWEDKIIREVTPVQFVATVNNWRKYTKKLFHRQTITLPQRQALKSWIRNAILANVHHHFTHFLGF